MSKILIVEDETIIRTALRKLLERNKYEVSEAPSIKEATSKFELSEFELIISDLRLPGAPGTDLIKLAGDVPVLIMTSYASLRSAVDSMRMGAVDRSEEHTSELQSRGHLVCRLLLETKEAKSSSAFGGSVHSSGPMPA